jgi:hypothetical protein
MAKKPRIDSVSAQLEALASISRDVCPPEHVALSAIEFPFWESIIGQGAREWSRDDLEVVALLARAMCRIEIDTRALAGEDSVEKSAGGTRMPNPRLRIIGDMHAQIIKYRQTLGLHDRGKNGEKRDAEKRRSAINDLDARQRVQGFDDLLNGRPN